MVRRIDTKKLTQVTAAKQLTKAEEKAMEPIKSLIAETLERAKFEVHDNGYFKPIETIVKNDNEYQEVESFGLRIRPSSDKNNSSGRIMEALAKKREEGGSSTLYKSITDNFPSSREEILKKLKDPKLADEIKKFIDESSTHFLLED